MHTPIHPVCWLCGEAVDLRKCKIDEYGEAVHETCYIARIAFESGTRNAMSSKLDMHIHIMRP